MLSAVKQHLAMQKIARLTDLADRFHVEPLIMRQMLKHWIQKGYVNQLPLPMTCAKSCMKCDPLKLEVYRWIEQSN